MLLAMGASAGEFSVSPVRIFMGPHDRAIAVTVVNEGSEDLVMQSELYTWQQKPDGSDDLQPTEDVVLSPPIVKLAPKARQVLRLARVGVPPTDREQSYRLIVREVPEAKPSTDRNPKVQMALAFSLPIFITPSGAKRQMQCGVQRSSAQAVKVSCTNSGRAYAQIRGMSLTSTAGARVAASDVIGYILPDRQRSFDLKSTSTIPAGKVTLQVAFDDGTTQSFDGTLSD